MNYDLNYDENFENAINKILLDKNINISQYNNIFLYFPSTIIQRIFCKLSKRIKDFHLYGETNITYEIFYNYSYSFTKRYCHLYSEFSCYNKQDNSYTCTKCKKLKDCLIIQLDEKEFLNYFDFLFSNLQLK